MGDIFAHRWHILHDKASRHAFTQTLKAGAIFMLFGLFAAMDSGHMHAQYLEQVNPMKVSSFEALWETEDPAPFAIVADINEQELKNKKAASALFHALFARAQKTGQTLLIITHDIEALPSTSFPYRNLSLSPCGACAAGTPR